MGQVFLFTLPWMLERINGFYLCDIKILIYASQTPKAEQTERFLEFKTAGSSTQTRDDGL